MRQLIYGIVSAMLAMAATSALIALATQSVPQTETKETTVEIVLDELIVAQLKTLESRTLAQADAPRQHPSSP